MKQLSRKCLCSILPGQVLEGLLGIAWLTLGQALIKIMGHLFAAMAPLTTAFLFGAHGIFLWGAKLMGPVGTAREPPRHFYAYVKRFIYRF